MKPFLNLVNELVGQGIDFDSAVVSSLTFLINSGMKGKAVYDLSDAAMKISNAIKAGQINSTLGTRALGLSISKSLDDSRISVVFHPETLLS